MKLLPSEKLLLQTPLDKALVLEQLRSIVLSNDPATAHQNIESLVFEGQLREDSFVLKRSISNNSMYFPEISGECHEAANGTTIALLLKPQNSVFKFMVLWLAGITLGILLITLAGFVKGGSKAAVLVPATLLAIGVGLTNAGFTSENKKARTALTKILDAEIMW